jgi:hypothetical protein
VEWLKVQALSSNPSTGKKKKKHAGGQWLMSVILAEAEIRRITVQSQRWANSLQDSMLKILNTRKGCVSVHPLGNKLILSYLMTEYQN